MNTIKKLIKFKDILLKEGFKKTLYFSLNNILKKFLGLNVIVRKNKLGDKVTRRVFSRCSIKYSDKGYYFLDPMPSEQELNEYYAANYWDSNGGKQLGINLRDLVHLNIMQKYVPEFIEGKNLLNFGAGHGGLSHLAWFQGLNVVNVEPSDLKKYYTHNWMTYKSIYEVPSNSVDICYGSHSLEHVQDIDKFIFEIKRVLTKESIMFWEVPNANCEIAGAKIGKVIAPHTYYFTNAFFENLFDEVILNKSYYDSDDSSDRFKIESWEDLESSKGEVIRACGKFKNHK